MLVPSKWYLRSDLRECFSGFSVLLRWCGLRLVPSLLLLGGWVLADSAAFDLPGPRIEVKVTRAGETLPISEVPNLQAGDRLWLHPEIPASQSVHYLLIVAFLRGSTKPAAGALVCESRNLEQRRCGKRESWSRFPRRQQQVLLFLAPETGGDFGNLTLGRSVTLARSLMILRIGFGGFFDSGEIRVG